MAAEFEERADYVENVVKLLDEGCTVPFIARYRKELHGTMDDQRIREISERLAYLRSPDKRRDEIRSAVEGDEKPGRSERPGVASQSAHTGWRRRPEYKCSLGSHKVCIRFLN